MSYSTFVHLRTHSAYSLSEGAITVDALVDLTVKNSMPAVAMTDTNNIFGALEFSTAASEKGVQPILGTQLNICPLLEQRDVSLQPDQLVLLVQNRQGYTNLMELLSIAFMETKEYCTPQVSMEVLRRLSSGLLCLTAGKQGAINKLLVKGQKQKAREYLSTLHTIFGDRLYIELQRHNHSEQDLVEPLLIEYAYDRHIGLVATNNVFFATKDMFEAHDALLCVAQGVVVEERKRFALNPEYYYKSEQEMRALFKDIPEAIDNTVLIAKRCAYKVAESAPLLPEYPYLKGRTERETLQVLTQEGLQERLQERQDKNENAAVVEEYEDRMQTELAIIEQMGFAGYFLIVADIVQWAKREGIPVGPGRGSGAGSIVAWALKITDLDPIKFGLLFERFLNPERISMPDFDIDFCQSRRDEVIAYVQKQYGHDKVAQIITFGKLQARAVVKDVGRVLSIPYGQVDSICKRIPNIPTNPVTLAQIVEKDAIIKAEMTKEPMVAKLITLALKLEGLYRHASTHAAGVVIGDRALHKLVALYRDPKSDIPVTQFNVKFVEKAGLVKFDFLGLKTLSIIQMAVDLINKRRQHLPPIHISHIDLSDKKTYTMIAQGRTVGVFQLESAGMRRVLVELKPDRLEDIIAVVALYRPGPMENISKYIARKHGQVKAEYLHPVLKPLLEETFGIPVYQEQVMQMAQTLAGYSLGSADLLRRAMGKKIPSEMEKQRQIFKDGAKFHHGVTERLADSIFDKISAFAGYGFNKSHAAAYAVLSYQTAWLKANYPVEFMAASMTYEMGNTDKLRIFKQDLDAMNISLLPPDINASFEVFVPELCLKGDGREVLSIRYALSALKNVGEGAVKRLVTVRKNVGKFTTIYDFFRQVDTKDLNRRMVENICKSGAFDNLYANRKQLLSAVDSLLKYAVAVQEEKDSRQDNLFGEDFSQTWQPQLAPPEQSPDFKEIDKLTEECKAVGFYLSAHPLSLYKEEMDAFDIVEYGSLLTQSANSGTIRLAGVVVSTSFLKTQKSESMIVADFTDVTGIFSVVFFDKIAKDAQKLLEVGNILCLTCFYTLREHSGKEVEADKTIRLNASSISLLEDEIGKLKNGLKIFIQEEKPLPAIKDILNSNKGKGKHVVYFILSTPIGSVEMILKDKYALNRDISNQIAAIDGVVHVCDF